MKSQFTILGLLASLVLVLSQGSFAHPKVSDSSDRGEYSAEYLDGKTILIHAGSGNLFFKNGFWGPSVTISQEDYACRLMVTRQGKGKVILTTMAGNTVYANAKNATVSHRSDYIDNDDQGQYFRIYYHDNDFYSFESPVINGAFFDENKIGKLHQITGACYSEHPKFKVIVD